MKLEEKMKLLSDAYERNVLLFTDEKADVKTFGSYGRTKLVWQSSIIILVYFCNIIYCSLNSSI